MYGLYVPTAWTKLGEALGELALRSKRLASGNCGSLSRLASLVCNAQGKHGRPILPKARPSFVDRAITCDRHRQRLMDLVLTVEWRYTGLNDVWATLTVNPRCEVC